MSRENGDELKLTEDQIAYFNDHGLRVPKKISTELLEAADSLALGLFRLFFIPSEPRRQGVILDFKQVIKPGKK